MEISVVIPTRNEESTIGAIIGALAGQASRPSEIIVVDAGSTDRTREVALASRTGGCPVRVVAADNAYPGTARNLGARQCQAPWIAFLDAGVSINGGWLERMAAAASEGADIVMSPWKPRQDSLFRRLYYLAYSFPEGMPGMPGVHCFHGAFLLIRRALWERVGGYPPFRASEDRQFLEEVRRTEGVRLVHAQGAVVTWDPPADFSSAMSKAVLYGYHDILAGRSCDWHFGVLRLYGLTGLLSAIVAAVRVSWFPWWLPWPLLMGARMAKRVALRWRGSEFRWWEFPLGLVAGAGLLVATDLAAMASLGLYVWRHQVLRRPSPYAAA